MKHNQQTKRDAVAMITMMQMEKTPEHKIGLRTMEMIDAYVRGHDTFDRVVFLSSVVVGAFVLDMSHPVAPDVRDLFLSAADRNSLPGVWSTTVLSITASGLSETAPFESEIFFTDAIQRAHPSEVGVAGVTRMMMATSDLIDQMSAIAPEWDSAKRLFNVGVVVSDKHWEEEEDA